MAPKLGFEAAGGALGKFLPGVSFPVLMNAALPGALASVALFPLTPVDLTKLLSASVENTWSKLALAAIVVIALGGLISLLNSRFYELYEGRNWPRRVFEWGRALQQRRVERLDRRQRAEKGVHEQRYKEIWYRLRVYPINTFGKRYASHPTLLGNILYAYEEYPEDRYGMDAIFYWPRLWLIVDKDNRDDISKSWIVADGLVNLSAVSWIACLVWAAVACGSLFHLWKPEHLPVHNNFSRTWAAIGGWFILGYFFYRLSLSFHRSNGEVFKSLFDIYKDKLSKLTSLAPNEGERWKAAWAYLQYLRIKCPKCGKGYVSIYDHQCSKEGCDVAMTEINTLVEEFRRTGKLVKELATDQSAKNELRDVLQQFLKALDGDE
jgi:hypothetical protein